MTDADKLINLKSILGISDSAHDTELNVYLTLIAQEIIGWKYSLIGIPDNAVVPYEDEIAQIMACAAGYGHKGAPDELVHNENGINRTWKHNDAISYVRSNVIPYARV